MELALKHRERIFVSALIDKEHSSYRVLWCCKSPNTDATGPPGAVGKKGKTPPKKFLALMPIGCESCQRVLWCFRTKVRCCICKHLCCWECSTVSLTERGQVCLPCVRGSSSHKQFELLWQENLQLKNELQYIKNMLTRLAPSSDADDAKVIIVQDAPVRESLLAPEVMETTTVADAAENLLVAEELRVEAVEAKSSHMNESRRLSFSERRSGRRDHSMTHVISDDVEGMDTSGNSPSIMARGESVGSIGSVSDWSDATTLVTELTPCEEDTTDDAFPTLSRVQAFDEVMTNPNLIAGIVVDSKLMTKNFGKDSKTSADRDRDVRSLIASGYCPHYLTGFCKARLFCVLKHKIDQCPYCDELKPNQAHLKTCFRTKLRTRLTA
eukprot:TRINITY_DN10659_c0_g2_i1.p1 TRINITY_DN10659_c0_g2~~TRINITY_DN10659_c0_g2_i1.p1  ORF type:complete len:383 (-),score=75.69 TRINITY_DN10659_c0_g2_i1:104-1252(-)